MDCVGRIVCFVSLEREQKERYHREDRGHSLCAVGFVSSRSSFVWPCLLPVGRLVSVKPVSPIKSVCVVYTATSVRPMDTVVWSVMRRSPALASHIVQPSKHKTPVVPQLTFVAASNPVGAMTTVEHNTHAHSYHSIKFASVFPHTRSSTLQHKGT